MLWSLLDWRSRLAQALYAATSFLLLEYKPGVKDLWKAFFTCQKWLMASSRAAAQNNSWSASTLPKQVHLCAQTTEHWFLSLGHHYPALKISKHILKFILLWKWKRRSSTRQAKNCNGLRQAYYTASGFSDSLFNTAWISSNCSHWYINSLSSKKSRLWSKKICAPGKTDCLCPQRTAE